MAKPKIDIDDLDGKQSKLNKAIDDAYQSGAADQKRKSSAKSADYSGKFGGEDEDIVPALTVLSGLPFGLGKIAGSIGALINTARAALSPLSITREFLRPLEIDSQRKLFTQIKGELGDLTRLTKQANNETVEAFRLSRESINKDYASTVKDLEASKPELVLDVMLDDGTVQKRKYKE